MSDETDRSSNEVEMAFDSMTEMLEGIFGPSPFGDEGGVEVDRETEIAITCMQAAHAIDEIADYMDDRDDLDIDDPSTYDSADIGDKAVLMGLGLIGTAIEDFGDAIGDDDGDENRFKVSDGDDPIY